MTTLTTNPHRPKALAYSRDHRVFIQHAAFPAGLVLAHIEPAPGDRSGASVRVTVRLAGGIWDCTEHPGANECAHRLAVQSVTGQGHLGGRWRA